MGLFTRRSRIYVNTELQFRYSVILIIVVTIEAIVFSIPFSYAFKILVTSNIPEKVYLFYAILLLSFGIITVLNIFLGTLLSHKIAGPLYNFEQRIKAITNGDLTTFAELREGDELKDFGISFNEMIRALKKAVIQDRETIKKINEKLKKLDKSLDTLKGENKEEMRKTLREISNDMKEITGFFKCSKG
jgi:methyl-accepting chemotaxis protein